MSMEQNDRISFLLALQLTLISVKNLFVVNNNKLVVYNDKLNLLVTAIVFFAFFTELLREGFKTSISLKAVILCVAILLFWIVSYLALYDEFVQYAAIKKRFVYFVGYCLCGLLFIPTLPRPEAILKYFYKLRHIVFAATIISAISYYGNGMRAVDGLNYSMALGANSVLTCLVFLSGFKRKGNKIDLICALVNIYCIITIASRYPLLYIAAYVLLSVFLRLTFTAKAAFILLGLAGGAIFIGNLEHILKLAAQVLMSLGMSGRTVRMLDSGSLADSNGRNNIHENMFAGLARSPLLGYGAGGGAVALDGVEPHGFYFDWIGTFGYVLGNVLFCVVFFWLIGSIIRKLHTSCGELVLILSCCFFPTILIQESVWTSYKFWWLVALCLNPNNAPVSADGSDKRPRVQTQRRRAATVRSLAGGSG